MWRRDVLGGELRAIEAATTIAATICFAAPDAIEHVERTRLTGQSDIGATTLRTVHIPRVESEFEPMVSPAPPKSEGCPAPGGSEAEGE